jgi:hypothetical protein
LNTLKHRLASLDPSVKYTLESRGDVFVITLIDPKTPAKVERSLLSRHAANQELMDTIIEDAIHELRRKSSAVARNSSR